MSRRGLCALAAIVVAAAVFAVGGAAAGAGATKPAQVGVGQKLYRQYCGKCHALSAALSAGFGNSSGGLGTLGGPSFNNLRIPYMYSISAVTEPTGGHEVVGKKISAKELSEVATYIAQVTAHHPIPALPTDG